MYYKLPEIIVIPTLIKIPRIMKCIILKYKINIY